MICSEFPAHFLVNFSESGSEHCKICISFVLYVGPENHREYIKSKVVTVEVAPFKPKSNVTIHTTDSEARAAEQGSVGKEDCTHCYKCGSAFWWLSVIRNSRKFRR